MCMFLDYINQLSRDDEIVLIAQMVREVRFAHLHIIICIIQFY